MIRHPNNSHACIREAHEPASYLRKPFFRFEVVGRLGASLYVVCSMILLSTVPSWAEDYVYSAWAGNSSAAVQEGPRLNVSLSDIQLLAGDAAGNIFFTTGETVRRIDPSGKVSILAGTQGVRGKEDGVGAEAHFNNISGITVRKDGTVFISDGGNGTIRSLTPAGVVSRWAGTVPGYKDGDKDSAAFLFPAGLGFDSAGNLFVADNAANMIRRITPGGVVTTFAGSGRQGTNDGTGKAASFYWPYGVAEGPENSVFVTDTMNNTIRKIDSKGDVSTVAGVPGVDPGHKDGLAAAARLFHPTCIAADISGNVYVSERDNACLRKISPAGFVTTIGGKVNSSGIGVAGMTDGIATNALFSGPFGLYLAPGHNLFVAEVASRKIRLGRVVQPLLTLIVSNYEFGLSSSPASDAFQVEASDDLIRWQPVEQSELINGQFKSDFTQGSKSRFFRLRLP